MGRNIILAMAVLLAGVAAPILWAVPADAQQQGPQPRLLPPLPPPDPPPAEPPAAQPPQPLLPKPPAAQQPQPLQAPPPVAQPPQPLAPQPPAAQPPAAQPPTVKPPTVKPPVAKPVPAKPPAAPPPPPEPVDERIIEVCNSTKRVLNIAIAEPAGEHNAKGEDLFISRGWHVLQPNQCRAVFGPGLSFRYYYVYAEGITGSRSGGVFPFCIRKEAFTIKAVQCDPKFSYANFSQIDTSSSGTRSITYNFRE